jgi:hypothetical protein
MEVAKTFWYWVPEPFQVVPLPTTAPVYKSYIPIGLVWYLGIHYPGYISGVAPIETQAEVAFPASSSTSSCSTVSPFRSYILTPPSQGFSASPFETAGSRSQDDTFGAVKKCSEWYKNLDFEDAIFIPNFFKDDPRRLPHAVRVLQQRANSSSPVLPQYIRPSTPVVADSRADSWHIGPEHNAISASERTLDINVLTPPTSTPQSNRRLSMNLPNWSARPSNQPRPRQTPPPSYALLTPPSSTARSSRTSQNTQEIAREIMAEQERINRQRGSKGPKSFIPSRAVLERNRQKLIGAETPESSPNRPLGGAKHYGRPIPPHKNCAIFITEIPIQATYADVLGSVRGGKIYACRFEPDTGKFPTRAVKLVFFTRAAAEVFMQRSYLAGVFIRGKRVRAIWNRIRYDAHPSPHQSRVVNITGPARWVGSGFLEEWFEPRFDYDLDHVVDIPCSREGYATRAWHFACLRAQAEFAKMIIERELNDIFKVEYGVDPCARPWF